MENTNVQRAKQVCQQTKNSVFGVIEEFLQYIDLCLGVEEYENAINSLLPFDKIVQIKLKNAYDQSLVRAMGLSVMRMEFNPSVFSLGVSLEIAEGKYNQAVNTTVFISACRTLEELRDYVKTEEFAKQVKETYEKQVEDSFFHRC